MKYINTIWRDLINRGCAKKGRSYGRRPFHVSHRAWV